VAAQRRERLSGEDPMHAVARARSNVALVKYWGKRDLASNLPATGSLSLTLDRLTTRTEVRFDRARRDDVLLLDGRSETGQALERVTRLLDLVRARADLRAGAAVTSVNDFPTAAGLASSASGFAALAAAAARAAGLRLSLDELSDLARRGSGSAARSIHGGFVELGMSGIAAPVVAPADFAPRVVVALTSGSSKPIGSTTGMQETAATSPYYEPWVRTHAADLEAARDAVAGGDLEALGAIAEASCLKMHAAALAARPAIVYWSGITVELMHRVRWLREGGTPAYFTIDAGPQVKVICHSQDAIGVADELTRVHGVLRTITCAPGAGVEIIEDHA
jgi:diphosphomevalonate decarboxylase